MKNFKGFTLAEVLITLGVIGVVAAMTLPTLIQNYQKKVWTTQLQKSYSLLEQSFQKIMADDEVQKFSDTSVWASKGIDGCSRDSYTTSNRCIAFANSLKKYIKFIGIEKYNNKFAYLKGNRYSDYGNYDFFTLPDGTMLYFNLLGEPGTKTEEICNQIKSLGGNMCSSIGSVFIDVNGKKKPNTFGRDIFVFSISDDGKLHPKSGKDEALNKSQTALDNNTKYWRKTTSFCGTHDSSEIPNNTMGDGCAARIMENGWKMDY
ncbi:prepilin-type N-terminal cleavage/methylation domain-containing protein [bacterium]|nr:prepilin-type N-terminal cleavage/methylation domain-containing protein [bacterium]